MISRLSAYAAAFAVLATVSVGYTASAVQAASATPTVTLQTVVITGHRIAQP